MAARFNFSAPGRRGPGDPWFRIGAFDVTTTILVLAIEVVGLILYAVNRSALRHLFLYSSDFRHGQIWRAVTWPIPNDISGNQGIWVIFMLLIFWYFGTQLEHLLGRVKLAVLIGGLAVVPGVIGGLLNLAPDVQPIFGFRGIELCIFVLFVAEYPFARFFFGIPAWVLGVAIVGIEFIQIIGDRDFYPYPERLLLFRVISFVVAGLLARSLGLLRNLPWIPVIPLGPLSGTPRQRKPKRPRKPGRGGGDVVAGPWSAPRPGPTGSAPLPQPPVSAADVAADQAELDELLDKISESGMDGLTTSEKQRLNELSKRMRNRP
jgi:hypothetical protein